MGQADDVSQDARNAGQPLDWRPGIALRVSAGLHGLGVLLLIAQPQWWAPILAALVFNHAALALLGLWPRSQWLGANMLRLPPAAVQRNEIALTFDDGPDPDVTLKVLDILDAYQAKASFFVIADKAAARPDLIREIVNRGHSVENHSRRHPGLFGFFGWTALKSEIGTAQQIIAGLTGRAPAFFRAPMGIRNPLLDPVVARFGLRYVSWTRRGFDTMARDPGVVLRRLTRDLAAGDILLLHDRWTRRYGAIALDVLPGLLSRISAAGLRPVTLPLAMR